MVTGLRDGSTVKACQAKCDNLCFGPWISRKSQMGVVCACHPNLGQTEPRDPGASWLARQVNTASPIFRKSFNVYGREGLRTVPNTVLHTCKCEYTLMHTTHTYKHTIGISMNSKLFSLYCEHLAMAVSGGSW